MRKELAEHPIEKVGKKLRDPHALDWRKQIS
jgi:hypothetical protein